MCFGFVFICIILTVISSFLKGINFQICLVSFDILFLVHSYDSILYFFKHFIMMVYTEYIIQIILIPEFFEGVPKLVVYF